MRRVGNTCEIGADYGPVALYHDDPPILMRHFIAITIRYAFDEYMSFHFGPRFSENFRCHTHDAASGGMRFSSEGLAYVGCAGQAKQEL
ncbi:hypothetical protein GCM10027093_68510 [Paraburkholderia jirisanensis]